MKKTAFLAFLFIFGLPLVLGREFEENIISIITFDEYMSLDERINAYRGEKIKELITKLGEPSSKEFFFPDKEWLENTISYYGLKEYKKMQISAESRICDLHWYYDDKTFFVLSPNMKYAVRKCYFDEVYAAEQDGEWIVFASRRSVASFEEPN